MDSGGSATISYPDSLQSDWSVSAGQTVVSRCPVTVSDHAAVSRFDDGLVVRSSKCVMGLQPRMTAPVTDCQGAPPLR